MANSRLHRLNKTQAVEWSLEIVEKRSVVAIMKSLLFCAGPNQPWVCPAYATRTPGEYQSKMCRENLVKSQSTPLGHARMVKIVKVLNSENNSRG